ncbi:cytochrome P450 [Mucor lusitanicus]|uniref:Cytochrome P450 n=1 Tax=Mucor circinelloides f. lusitanicus TaxID=29924 RepID=A0A8H4BHZ8_MUCCL|nr:cytochrome P450 [Mucor lusitanicus]
MIVDNVLYSYHSAVDNVLPMLRRRSKGSYIGMAILCLVIKQVYSAYSVPNHLKRFPKVSFLAMIRSFLIKESVANRTKRLVTPLTNAGHGFYVCKIPLTWTVFVTDPVAAKTLLLKTEYFPKSHAFFDTLGDSSPAVQFLGKQNVASSNGEKWKKQRKIMNPAFLRASPVKTFSSVAHNLIDVIETESEAVPIANRMKAFTLDALGLSAFGFDFQSLNGDTEGWTETYNIVITSLFNPYVNIFAKVDFLMKYISPERRRINRATTRFNDMLQGLADTRRQEILNGETKDVLEHEKDLLTLMIEADIRDGSETLTTELRHNIAIFFLAGHDTTAHTLAFCLYNLAKYKDVQRKAREEVLHILGDEPRDVDPTMEDLKRMDYMTLIIKENLRRYGPVDKLLSRDAARDIDLNGTLIPQGQKISIDFNAIHMNPKIWHDPEEFIPERFEPNGEHDQHTGFTWLPFSNGSRQCIGMNFSLTEQKVLLSMILRKYEIDIDIKSPHYQHVVFDTAFTFAPQSLCLRFNKRY